MIEKTRLDDMLERYGEICPQVKAAKILGVTPQTINRMLKAGRLRRVGVHVDVRSICEYIEHPYEVNFQAHTRKKYPRLSVSADDFLAASMHRGL